METSFGNDKNQWQWQYAMLFLEFVVLLFFVWPKLGRVLSPAVLTNLGFGVTMLSCWQSLRFVDKLWMFVQKLEF